MTLSVAVVAAACWLFSTVKRIKPSDSMQIILVLAGIGMCFLGLDFFIKGLRMLFNRPFQAKLLPMAVELKSLLTQQPVLDPYTVYFTENG